MSAAGGQLSDSYCSPSSIAAAGSVSCSRSIGVGMGGIVGSVVCALVVLMVWVVSGPAAFGWGVLLSNVPRASARLRFCDSVAGVSLIWSPP